MDLFAILFVFLLLIACGKDGKNTSEKPWLSKETGQCMRGWFAIAIIFHHLSQRTHDGLLFRLFLFVGVYCVSCFLFYSGYGLMKNCMRRKDYEKQYFRRRFLPVFLPFVLYNLILWSVYRWEGTFYTFHDFISLLWRGEPMAIFSWYVYFILLFYALFYLLMKVSGKNTERMIRGALIFDLIYILFCVWRGWGIWWYNTAHILIFGMYYAAHEERCDEWIQNRQKKLILVCGFILIAFSALPYILPYRFQLPLYILITLSFTVLMIALLMRRVPDNPVLKFLGRIAYELYLVHEIFILVYRGSHIYMESDFVWTLAVLICSVILAYAYHQLFDGVLRLIRRI